MARFGSIPTQLDIPASNFIRRNVGDTAFEAASDVVIDGDFASGGLMKRGTNPGDYSIIGGSSAIDTVEASLTDDATHMATSAAIYAAIASAVSAEDFWDRTGTVLHPGTSGDSIHINVIDEEIADAGVTIEGIKFENSESLYPVGTGKITFGDEDTYIYESNDDNLRIYVGGTERAKLDGNNFCISEKGLLIDQISYGFTARVDAANLNMQEIVYSNTAGQSVVDHFFRFGGTQVSPTVAPASANIALYRYYLYDGAANLEVARIGAFGSDTPSSGSASGYLAFYTRQTTGSLTAHMVLGAAGDLQINTIKERTGAAGVNIQNNFLIKDIEASFYRIEDTTQPYFVNFHKERVTGQTAVVNDSIGRIRGYFYNDAVTPELIEGVRINMQVKGVTDGSEYAELAFHNIINGALVKSLSIGTAGVAFSSGAVVNTIETTLTNDDTHLPTSGAVVDALAAVYYWGRTGTVLSPATADDTIEVSSPTYPVANFVRTSNATATLYGVMQVKHKSTSDVSDGFGSGLNFIGEDSDTVEHSYGYIGAVRSGADNNGAIELYSIDSGVGELVLRGIGGGATYLYNDGSLVMQTDSTGILTNTIGEINSSVGVTVDGMLIRDGGIGTSTTYQGNAYLSFLGLSKESGDVYASSHVYSTSNTPAFQYISYRYGGTRTAPAAAPTGAWIKHLRAFANDGTTNLEVIRQTFRVSGAVATDNVAGILYWMIRPSGVAGTLDFIMSLDESGLNIDNITEYTADAGVTIEGVRAENNNLYVGSANGLYSAAYGSAYMTPYTTAGGAGMVFSAYGNIRWNVWDTVGYNEKMVLTYANGGTLAIDNIIEHLASAGVTVDTMLLKDYVISCPDGSASNGQPITLKAGDPNGVGNDGGSVTIKAGNALAADAASTPGGVYLMPGNPYQTSVTSQVFLGDNTYNADVIGIQTIGTQTDVDMTLSTKGAGAININSAVITFGTGIAGTLPNDNAETTVVAYDTTTGLLSYRTIASINPVDNILDWNGTAYAPYAAQTTGAFDSGSVNPISAVNRLNFDGEFYAYNLYAGNATDHVTITSGGQVLIYTGGANQMIFQPYVSDSGGAVAYSFDTENTLVTAGAKIATFQTNGTERFAIYGDGKIGIPSTGHFDWGTSGNSTIDILDGSGIHMSMKHWGNVVVVIDSNNTDTNRYFAVMTNSADVATATTLFEVTDDVTVNIPQAVAGVNATVNITHSDNTNAGSNVVLSLNVTGGATTNIYSYNDVITGTIGGVTKAGASVLYAGTDSTSLVMMTSGNVPVYLSRNNGGIMLELTSVGTKITIPATAQNYAVLTDVSGNLTRTAVSGSPSTDFLRGDGTWATPAGSGAGNPAGSDHHVQFNDAGSFGGNAGFQWIDNAWVSIGGTTVRDTGERLHIYNNTTYTWSQLIRTGTVYSHGLWIKLHGTSSSTYSIACLQDAAGTPKYVFAVTNDGRSFFRGYSAGNYTLRVEPQTATGHGLQIDMTAYTSGAYNAIQVQDQADATKFTLTGAGDMYTAGDVGIGGTDATSKLYVYHNTSGQYAAYFNQDHATAHGIRVDIDASSGTTYTLFRGYRSTTKIAELRSDGDWWAADYVLSSDRRLKDVYAYVNDGLDIVMKLNPVTYRWKDNRDDNIHIGFIAQEVQKIRPELVKGGCDDFLSLSYIKMSALAIAGIQGLNRKVDTIEDTLRKELIDLKLRVKELENG